MSGYDLPQLYAVQPPQQTLHGTFHTFLRTFTDLRGFKYRDALRANILNGNWALRIEVNDVVEWEDRREEESDQEQQDNERMSVMIEKETERAMAIVGDTFC